MFPRIEIKSVMVDGTWCRQPHLLDKTEAGLCDTPLGPARALSPDEAAELLAAYGMPAREIDALTGRKAA